MYKELQQRITKYNSKTRLTCFNISISEIHDEAEDIFPHDEEYLEMLQEGLKRLRDLNIQLPNYTVIDGNDRKINNNYIVHINNQTYQYNAKLFGKYIGFFDIDTFSKNLPTTMFYDEGYVDYVFGDITIFKPHFELKENKEVKKGKFSYYTEINTNWVQPFEIKALNNIISEYLQKPYRIYMNNKKAFDILKTHDGMICFDIISSAHSYIVYFDPEAIQFKFDHDKHIKNI